MQHFVAITKNQKNIYMYIQKKNLDKNPYVCMKNYIK